MERQKSENGTQIVRQSSMKLLLDWSKTCDKCLTLKELTAMNEVVTEYVEYGYSKSIGERLDKIQQHLDTK